MRDSPLSILYQATKTKKSGDDKEQFKIVIKNKKQAVSVIGDLETEKITVNFADGNLRTTLISLSEPMASAQL